ncbi:HAD family hydrolase [Verrucomicrobia bacterium LW23]|nr:HAD family hydrolase [Verrucomicrobia bacterium LW23]
MKAVFLDKDGTLVEDVPYNVDIRQVRFAEGAIEGMTLLQDAGFRLFVISNQSGIALNYFSESDFRPMRQYICDSLDSFGIRLSGFYYCPHHPSGSRAEYATVCPCRKPAPGMLLRAAEEHSIDLHNSWMIGDILHDVEAGNRAGCRTVLLDVGGETEWLPGAFRTPDYAVTSLSEAVRKIIAAPGQVPVPAPCNLVKKAGVLAATAGRLAL